MPLTCTVDEWSVLSRVKLVESKGARGHMIFKVGDTVVYPHHGAALIEAIETRTNQG